MEGGGPTLSGTASATSMRSGGSTDWSFAIALRALAASDLSAKVETQRMPSVNASISAGDNIRGGRKITRAENITQAGFALDIRPESLKRGDVSIQRANADPEFIGQYPATYGRMVKAQDLQQIQEAFRPHTAISTAIF